MEGKTLGAAIRQAREEKGFSQEKLAELVNVSRQAVSKWETGLAVPTEENLCRLEQALGLGTGELSRWSEPTLPTAVPPGPRTFRRRLGLGAAALAVAVLGFGLGRVTVPPPLEAPLTKTIWRPVEYCDKGETTDHTERVTYDEMGNMLRREVNDGDQVFVQEAEYDERGNQIAYRSYYPDAVMNYSNEMEYDEMGNQTMNRVLKWNGTLDHWEEYSFDDCGNMTSYQFFNDRGELERAIRYTYTYFEDGSYEVDSINPNLGDSEPWHQLVERYDPYGNILSSLHYDIDGKLVESGEWTYQSFEVPVDFTPER